MHREDPMAKRKSARKVQGKNVRCVVHLPPDIVRQWALGALACDMRRSDWLARTILGAAGRFVLSDRGAPGGDGAQKELPAGGAGES